MSQRKIEKPKSITAFALDHIRSGITTGEYPLGGPLYEKVLAEQLNISKTPVREALLQLQHEGLVVVQPHSGTFVFELADGEVADLCELRLILETNAVQLAMRRQAGRLSANLNSITKEMRDAVKRKQTARYQQLDTEFHHSFFAYSGNKYLANAYTVIEGKLQALRVTLQKPLPSLLELSLNEHNKIAKSLEAGVASDAVRVLAEHIRRGRELMQELHEADPIVIETKGD